MSTINYSRSWAGVHTLIALQFALQFALYSLLLSNNSIANGYLVVLVARTVLCSYPRSLV